MSCKRHVGGLKSKAFLDIDVSYMVLRGIYSVNTL